MRSYWVRVTPMTHELVRQSSEDTEIEIQREDGHVKVQRQTHRSKTAM